VKQTSARNAAHDKTRLAPSGLIAGPSHEGAFVKTAVSFIGQIFPRALGAVADAYAIRFHSASKCFCSGE